MQDTLNKSKTSSPLFGMNYDAKGLRSMTRNQAERFLHTQSKMLSNFEAVTQAWVSSNRRNAEAAMEAVNRMCDCEDMSEVNKVYAEWMSGSMERMIADTRSMGEQSVHMLQDMVQGMETNVAEGAKAAKGASERMQSMSKRPAAV